MSGYQNFPPGTWVSLSVVLRSEWIKVPQRCMASGSPGFHRMNCPICGRKPLVFCLPESRKLLPQEDATDTRFWLEEEEKIGDGVGCCGHHVTVSRFSTLSPLEMGSRAGVN